jgi:NitT/TauT family transport system ATP-binding protein
MDLLDRLEIFLPTSLYPYQLSGGQGQMACIARALIGGPALLLLDEPFGSLDFEARILMREKLQDIVRITSVTTILVSHEIDEAIAVADRFVLLSDRPARIRATFLVDLPRPRTNESLTSAAFVDLKAQVLEAMGKEVV